MQLSLNVPSLPDVQRSCSSRAPQGCPQPELCPLTQARAGVAVRIKRLQADAQLAHRLREMGLGEEQQVTLLSKEVHVICRVCQSRVALSQELARTILVEPVSPRRKSAA